MKSILAAALLLALSLPAAAVDYGEIVLRLAGPDTQGRAVDTDLAAATDYLESQLSGLGDVVHQKVQVDGVTSSNLILLREPAQEGAGWIVVGAHYDHLGLGVPGEPNEGKVHFGADDNASGCAVLVGAASMLLSGPPTDRGLAIVFFTGEERGLLGSREFVASGPVAADEIQAMINIDTVGRLDVGEFSIFGVGTARVFSPALDGLNSVFDLPLQKIDPSSGASDDMAFVEAGIPAMHLFTGARPEYHRPGDTADLLDIDGLALLADFTVELADYLASGETAIDFVAPVAGSALADPERATEQRRRVSLGSIPDFNFTGEGVRISGVLPGSPAAEAGLQEGDLIVAFAGVGVADLTDYSEAMKRCAPGDVVQVDFLREGKAMQVEVTLAERR
ncbi:hypothetical protein DRQ32_01455 [bacterium]|nr:MAG: hypothetical protein DRQ32_01455 [bacterium]